MISNLKIKFENIFFKEQFRPSVLGLFLNPFYFGRRAIYKNIRRYSDKVYGNILDIGCGSKPYSSLFNCTEYIGLDVNITGHKHDKSKIDVFYDGVTMPFENNTFDSAVCFEVFQVVFNPEHFLKEIIRVTKPGSTIIFTVPFIWDEHEQPYDYARYSSFGLRYLFESTGYRILEHKKYLCDLRLLALLTNNYIYKSIRKIIPSHLSFLIILPLTSIVNILGHLLYLLPRIHDMYFGNIFLLKKPVPTGNKQS